ncbi:MAG: DUF2807 domain-containing protein [Bacteroidetes bacterium]|nr:MAG: DUF2807 domain-containing protein [Bacteroidota bacterium]
MNNRFILFVFLLAVLTGLHAHAQTTETRQLAAFHSLKSSGSLDIVLERGNSERVEISVRNIEPENIITEVENGVLKIYEKPRNRSWKNVSGKIYVTYRDLDGISVAGSGNVLGQDRISGRSLEIKCSGSGNLKLTRLDVGELLATLSGSANVELAGVADKQYLNISGSGNIQAEQLECEQTEAHISGSGNIDVVANEELNARITGSGNIRYRGEAPRTYTKTSGSGSISRVQN